MGGWTGEGSAGEMKTRGDQDMFNHILFHISNISYQILCFDDMFHIVSSYLAMLCWFVKPILPYFLTYIKRQKNNDGHVYKMGSLLTYDSYDGVPCSMFKASNGS